MAELGMAFAGLVVGYLLVGLVFGVVGDDGPLLLIAGPLITGVAAAFYGLVGPRWAAAVAELQEGDEAREPEAPSSVWAPPSMRPARPRIGWLGAVGTVIAGLLVALAGSVALGLLFELLGLRVEEQSSVLEITEGARANGFGTTAIMLAVSALLLAPVAEEWFFRGLLFRRVTACSGRGLGYVLSAVGFAAIHNNPAGFVVYLWLGLVFAAVLERTDRLWAAVAVHMGNNAYVLAVLFTAGAGGGGGV